MRLIDVDALKAVFEEKSSEAVCGVELCKAIISRINEVPTVDAVPVEFVVGNYNSEFVCDALTDDGDWCSEHCEFSEAQPECIHRYIERIWSAERRDDE